MLLRFSVRNHKSINKQQDLLFTSAVMDKTNALVLHSNISDIGHVVPVAMIYGANASGKSNFINALAHMRGAILQSHRFGKPQSAIPHFPFLLDPRARTATSEYEVDFVLDGTRLRYGFEQTSKEFVSEWLHSFSTNRKRVLFQRRGQKFKFNRELKGRNTIISDLTRPNSLYLSAAAQNDHPFLSKVSQFFERIHIVTQISIPGPMLFGALGKKGVDQRIIDFLSRVGTGVVGARRSKLELSKEQKDFRSAVTSIVQKYTNMEIDESLLEDEQKIELSHRDVNGAEVFFDLEMESDGTRRLLLILSNILEALRQGSVLIIDEFNASLHTQACEAVLAFFGSAKLNRKGAQLIATTHDTNLLRSALIRRDEIWFADKSKQGETYLYPLTNIRTKMTDNLEKGYLQGRYGATPFTKPILELVDELKLSFK